MQKNNPSMWAGLSVISGFIVGFLALIAAILAVLNEYDYIGAGLCFLAAALAFGFLANATLRD